MRSSAISKGTTEALVAMYRAAAVAYGCAQVAANHREANRQYDCIAAIYRELRRRGPDAQKMLTPLLTDEEAEVACWAAAHALEFAPDLGVTVLRALAPQRGFVGLDAMMVLEQWEAGALKFP